MSQELADSVDRDNIHTLVVMSEVVDRANHPRSNAGMRAATPASDVLPGPKVTDTSIHQARVLLSEQNMVGATRFALPKRVVMRVSRLFTHRLVGAVGAVADSVQALEATNNHAIGEVLQRDSDLQAQLDRLANTTRAQLTSTEIGAHDHIEAVARELRDARQTIASLELSVRGLEARILANEGSAAHERSELRRTRALMSRIARGGTGSVSGEGTAVAIAPLVATLDEATYLDFEQSFRGSRDEIRSRQRDALPYIDHLRPEGGRLLDLGCGRGEWLELLRSEGIPAYGVDSNASMVGDALNAGLDVVCGDALGHLENVEESTLQGVSAFQFVEHIAMDVLVKLLDECLLALRPGGILLLETPNPTNLVVGAATFYLDPTHLRPIHPDFLRFLVESRGFVDVEVHFVHPVIESSVLASGGPKEYEDVRLGRVVANVEWALFGPQDYILVARRAEVA